jgi:hypothetical protein
MTSRRNPFETKLAADTQPIYDSLRVAEPRRRNRQWEKAHQDQKATYRGVDPKLALRVKQIASDILVRDGEVARALLEYALRAYAEGDLELNARPHPDRMRMTLFPTSESARRCGRSTRPGGKKSRDESTWRVVTSWRGLPVELKREITALASDDGLNVPTGELVTALLRFSLKAFDFGLLKLEPVEETTGYCLPEGASL